MHKASISRPFVPLHHHPESVPLSLAIPTLSLCFCLSQFFSLQTRDFGAPKRKVGGKKTDMKENAGNRLCARVRVCVEHPSSTRSGAEFYEGERKRMKGLEDGERDRQQQGTAA